MAENNVLYNGSTAPYLNEGQQALGQQAFETAVAPLRESFNKDVTTTSEDLARKGKFFGELGSQSYERLIDKKNTQEAGVAGNIAVSLGQTAMDQAYQSSETAKQMQFEKDMQASGFEFATAERLGSQTYNTDMAKLGYEQTVGTDAAALGTGTQQQAIAGQKDIQQAGQEFTGTQADLDRKMQEAIQTNNIQAQKDLTAIQQQFTAAENDRARTFQSTQADLERKYGADQSQIAMDFQASQAQLQRDAAAGSQESEQIFNERMTRLQQDFSGNEAEAQRTFQAEEALLNRTLTVDESAKMKEFQAAQSKLDRDMIGAELTGDLNGVQTLKSKMYDEEKQRADTQNILNLALNGTLDKATAEQMMKETYGKPIQLSTNDELTMQRMATASGLSVDDYTKMRKAIGEGQMSYMFEVNEDGEFIHLDEFIDTPEKQKQFQMELAKQAVDAQLRLAEIQANTQKEVADTQAKGALAVEEEKRWFPSCVLSTVGYKKGWIDKKDMMNFVRWRTKFQKKYCLSNQSWTGYQVLSRSFIEKLPDPILKFIVLSWTKHVRHLIGKGSFSLSGYIVHKSLWISSMVVYMFNIKQCEELLKYYSSIDIGMMYRSIIKNVEQSKKGVI